MRRSTPRACLVAAFLAFPVTYPAHSQTPSPRAAKAVTRLPHPTPPNIVQPEADRRGTEQTPLIVKVLPPIPRTDATPAQLAAASQPEPSKGWAVADIIAATSAAAGLIQAIALIVTIWVLIRTARRQLRAYLYPIIGGIKYFSLTDPIVISVKTKNAGQTPARDVECSGSVFIGPLPIPDHWAIREPSEDQSIGRHSKLAIYPGLDNTVDLPSVDTLTPELIGVLKQIPAKWAVYVHGQISYIDIFDIKHVTSFLSFINSDDCVRLIESEEGTALPENFIVRFSASHLHNIFT